MIAVLLSYGSRLDALPWSWVYFQSKSPVNIDKTSPQPLRLNLRGARQSNSSSKITWSAAFDFTYLTQPSCLKPVESTKNASVEMMVGMQIAFWFQTAAKYLPISITWPPP